MFLAWFTLEHFCLTRANWWQRSPFMDKMTNSYLQGRCLTMRGYARMRCHLILEDNEVVEKPINLTSLSRKLVDKSVEVIRARARDERPFLLYHSFAHTHTPLFTEER